MKPNIGQSNVREPFPDFTDGADDFRQTNSVVEQFGVQVSSATFKSTSVADELTNTGNSSLQ
jgi:hypothetical protein